MDNPLFNDGDYDEFGVLKKPEEYDYQVWDSQWGWRRKSWLKKKRKKHFDDYKGAFEGKTYGSYDYGFSRKLKDDDFSAYDDYQQTGNWKGYSYYQKSTIDYRYIEQMANYFSAEANVTVVVGDDWNIDLKTKTLQYNPTSLMFGTKANVIACLLHEIGHLRHSTHLDDLKKGVLMTKYTEQAYKVLNLFEDFRIDEMMKTSYSGAEDIIDANIEIVKEMAKGYKAHSVKAQKFSEMMLGRLKESFVRYRSDMKSAKDEDEKKYAKKVLAYNLRNSGFGFSKNTQTLQKLVDKLLPLSDKEFDVEMDRIKATATQQGNIHDYFVGIITKAYGLPDEKLPDDIKKMVDETIHAVEPVKTMTSTQEVLDYMEKEVYPRVEELLKQKDEGNSGAKSVLGKGGARALIDKNAESGDNSGKMGGRMGKGGGIGTGKLPQEWSQGDYTALKESVDSAIKELIRRMNILKVNDMLTRYETHLKRGRLDTKRLYRFPTDNYDFFKKKKEVYDRTRNFAFSILTDNSGSMDGDNAIHATRGAIILSEVFNKFGIPFEIIKFGSNGLVIKKFDDKFDSNMKTRLGGCVNANGGGTNLSSGFEKSELTDRHEKNKYMVVLSDGGIGDTNEAIEKFREMEKKGVQGVGVNIETDYGGLVGILRKEQVKSITNANSLPSVFEEIMKEAIKNAK